MFATARKQRSGGAAVGVLSFQILEGLFAIQFSVDLARVFARGDVAFHSGGQAVLPFDDQSNPDTDLSQEVFFISKQEIASNPSSSTQSFISSKLSVYGVYPSSLKLIASGLLELMATNAKRSGPSSLQNQ